jgi:CBS domain-containing protein
MNRRVITVEPEATLRDVCKKMYKGVHRVIVARDGKAAGIITSFDVVRWIAERGGV